jgi:hypothetical protein
MVKSVVPFFLGSITPTGLRYQKKIITWPCGKWDFAQRDTATG